MSASKRKVSRELIFLTLASAGASAAFAGPTGPVVGVGNAVYAAPTLTVTSGTARTHISWQSFNLSANETMRFVQPNAQSVVLNHVFHPQSLNILGGVVSNGSVLFMHSGIVSGAGMNLDLAGMIDTSLRLPRLALAAGGMQSEAQIKPLATLAEGRIFVIGQDARLVHEAAGEWVLHAGRTIELANASAPNLRVQVRAPDSAAINLSRLVAGKGEAGIFAGLFRVPESARQAAERDVDIAPIAVMEDRVSDTPAGARFFRYASLFAAMRSDLVQVEGAAPPAEAGSGAMRLAALKSRPSLLPREIEIGAPAERLSEPVLARAAAPSEPAPEYIATLEPQPIAVAPESEPERLGAMLFEYLAARPVVEVVATLEPQPVLLRQTIETDDVPMLAERIALAPGSASSEPAPRRAERRPGAAVIVVARAQQSGMPAAEEGSSVKEMRIERRAPRYFQDYRGGVFFM